MAKKKEILEFLRKAVADQSQPALKHGRTITTVKILEIARKHLKGGVKLASVRRAVRELSATGTFRSAGRKGLTIDANGAGTPTVHAPPLTTLAGNLPIGLVLAESEDAFLSPVMRGIFRSAERAGHQVIVHNSALSAASEYDAIVRLLPITVGLIIVPVRSDSRCVEIERERAALGKHIVLLEREFMGQHAPDYPLVATDNRAGGHMAAEMLVQSLTLANGGATGILIPIARDNTSGQLERLEGFRELLTEKNAAVADAEFDCRPTLLLSPLDSGYPHLREGLSYHLGLNDPSSSFSTLVAACRSAPRTGRARRRLGIFCTADAIAISLLGLIVERIGPLVPDPIMIVGFDDLFYAEPIGLSSITQEFERLGEFAVYTCLERIIQDYRPLPKPARRLTTRVSLGERANASSH
jgi:DNA-binding LacI/PurR family transcriptional regulator